MALQSLDIVRRSATTLPEPEVRIPVGTKQVSKLIDTTKCIGCKACQARMHGMERPARRGRNQHRGVSEPARSGREHLDPDALCGGRKPQGATSSGSSARTGACIARTRAA